ncbi:MAG: adenylyl-sulfate kinase [Chlamydiota bacterium]|nr:adenylyl-sulfate kinase [Chlamydiota bacterium]
MSKGVTIWFTGLSGAGKSTITEVLERWLKDMGCKVEVLDGDVVRTNLSKGLGFSKEDRDTNIRRIGWVCKVLTRNDVVAIAAAISPYRDVRDEVRREVGSFIEVYVKASLDTCIKRDVKGLYKKALAGEIKEFTGVSDPYEEPHQPEIIADTENFSPEECAKQIILKMIEKNNLTKAQYDKWQKLCENIGS